MYVGAPATWILAGDVVGSCGITKMPTQNGEFNLELQKLSEPVVYQAENDILFLHFVLEETSQFIKLELAE